MSDPAYIIKKPCITIALLALLCAAIPAEGIIWEKSGSGIAEHNMISLAQSIINPSVIYACSGEALYMSRDKGLTWTVQMSLRGTGNAFNAIAADPLDAAHVYAGTSSGIYLVTESGRWEKIFQASGPGQGMILSIMVSERNPDVIYAGTMDTVLVSRDRGDTWTAGANLPHMLFVTSITENTNAPSAVYASSARGIFRSTNQGLAWENIYNTSKRDEELQRLINEEGTWLTESLYIRSLSSVRDITISPDSSKQLYAATDRGVLGSSNSGETWELLPDSGLQSRDIRDLAIMQDSTQVLIAATGMGLFSYSPVTQSWKSVYEGMDSVIINSIEGSAGADMLWAAGDRGIYYASVTGGNNNNPGGVSPEAAGKKADDASNVLTQFDSEPSIGDIREAAIEYAEVSPEKIRKWRRAASMKALLPDLHFDYNRDHGWQDSYSFYKVDGSYEKFDDITRARGRDWSVSLTWELGDLIWNSAQTSIDSRSRLMVQLREDILKDVTRLYYERRRLQIELALHQPASQEERLKKELRLQELTADIDALTGSRMSGEIRQ